MKSGQKKKKINKAEVIGNGAAHCTGISHLAGIPGV